MHKAILVLFMAAITILTACNLWHVALMDQKMDDIRRINNETRDNTACIAWPDDNACEID